MKPYIRKHKKRGGSGPLVLPPNERAGWSIEVEENSPYGNTSIHESTKNIQIRLPNDTGVCECGFDHNDSEATHEMMHAQLSPDPQTMSRTLKGSTKRISDFAIELAEEFRVNLWAEAVHAEAEIPFHYTCKHRVLADMKTAVEKESLREILKALMPSGLTPYEMQEQAHYYILKSYHPLIRKAKKGETLSLREEASTKNLQALEEITNSFFEYLASAQYKLDPSAPKDWNRVLHLAAQIDSIVEVEHELKAQQYKKLTDESKIKEETPDLKPLHNIKSVYEKTREENPEDPSKKATAAIQKMLDDDTPATDGDPSEFWKKDSYDPGPDKGNTPDWGSEVRWHTPTTWDGGKLKLSKRQKKIKGSTEGAIPVYMHRWASDQAIFRKVKRVAGGTVLLDLSGSMHYHEAQFEEIVKAAPAATIVGYSGGTSDGDMVYIAKNGKWITYETAREYSPYSGNTIDLPALEWLATQPEPRVWVSDGHVIPAYGNRVKAIDQCIQACIKGKITRVNNAREAWEIFKGERPLER